ncbi:MAG: hypothetical protein HFJ52_02880 [Clostridia bacterium]|nr:hypothetical protein [Clostridia bacterium]
MLNEDNYIIENETTDRHKKEEYWHTGIGLNLDNDKLIVKELFENK